MDLRKCKEEYARLLVLGGVCLKEGERVVIASDVVSAEMAELVAKTAYECGASKVEMRWSSARVDAYAYEHANVEFLKEFDEWEEKKWELQVEQLPCLINLVSSEPIEFTSEMLTNQANVMKERAPKIMSYRDKMDGKFKWTIGGVATQAWADQVFPGEEGNLDHLWRSIFTTLMITGEGDSIEKWDETWEKIHAHEDYLNKLDLKTVHVETSLGTDLTMDLSEDVLWEGGSDRVLGNAPNLPSAEVFTSPVASSTEGVMVSSKPLVCQNQVIEGIRLVFKEGKIVEATAEKGEEFFKKYLETDEGALRLGEIAIIDKYSPIKNAGHVFFHTLFDENVACHIAIGRAFPFLLKDFKNMTAEEVAASIARTDLNQSGIHCDIMFGTPDVTVTGTTRDGKVVEIMKNGEWCN